MLQVVWT